MTMVSSTAASFVDKSKNYVQYVYLGFRARQHLRLMAPVMNDEDDDNDDQMILGNLGGLKLPDICLTGEEKPRKNLTQAVAHPGFYLGRG